MRSSTSIALSTLLVAAAAAVALAQPVDPEGSPACCALSSLDPPCEVAALDACLGDLGVPVPGSVCCSLPALGDTCTGNACDTGLSGPCAEGTYACADGELACEPASLPTAEVCDGVDNDCDPATPDGAESSTVGSPCDGPDGDGCQEGVVLCSAGTLVCSDTTGTNVEICDHIDNDCDGLTDEDGCP